MANQKFYEAARRGKLPYPTSRADVGKGWPLVLYPWFLACAQLPDGDTIARDAFTLHMGDSIRAGALPAVRQRIPWFIENEVIEPHVTAQDFAAWLASEGVTPSPLVAEWFKHQGVASPAAALSAAPAAAPVADSASNAPAWTVTKPKRYSGYAAPLHRFLAAAHREGKPRPLPAMCWRHGAASALPESQKCWPMGSTTSTRTAMKKQPTLKQSARQSDV